MGVTTRIVAAMLVVATTGGMASVAGTPPRVIERAGGWEAFMGNIREGSPACGLSNHVANADLKMFLVKWFYGQDSLTIQITKQNWQIPKGAKGRISITFDNSALFVGTATAHPSGHMMELTVPISEINNFMREFRDSDRMTVRFLSGNEQPWWADMAGSRAVGFAFEQCVTNYLEQMNATQPTKPYGTPPTQPYGTQPVEQDATPTQPIEPRPSLPVRKPVLRTPADSI